MKRPSDPCLHFRPEWYDVFTRMPRGREYKQRSDTISEDQSILAFPSSLGMFVEKLKKKWEEKKWEKKSGEKKRSTSLTCGIEKRVGKLTFLQAPCDISVPGMH